jgi:hypothetical protein
MTTHMRPFKKTYVVRYDFTIAFLCPVLQLLMEIVVLDGACRRTPCCEYRERPFTEVGADPGAREHQAVVSGRGCRVELSVRGHRPRLLNHLSGVETGRIRSITHTHGRSGDPGSVSTTTDGL